MLELQVYHIPWCLWCKPLGNLVCTCDVIWFRSHSSDCRKMAEYMVHSLGRPYNYGRPITIDVYAMAKHKDITLGGLQPKCVVKGGSMPVEVIRDGIWSPGVST